MFIKEVALHTIGLPGVVMDKQCVGEVESIVKVNIWGKTEAITTRDDCITNQMVYRGDRVWVRKRIGMILPPTINKI